MLTDPILSGYLANLGSDLTGAVIAALRRRAEEFALGTPKYQALKRCYAAAEAALLPPGDPLFALYRPVLQTYLADPDVARELAKLARGNTPDTTTLVDLFAEFTTDAGLPPFDLSPRLAAALEAFLQMAEQEKELQPVIQTAQLRDQTDLLRRLPEKIAAAIAGQVQAIRSGDVAFWQGATIYGDIVTGLKIVNQLPPPPQPDPCLELGRRYLAALAGQVTELPLAALGKEGAAGKPVTLDQVYISLNTTRQAELTETEKNEAQFEQRMEGKKPVAALEAAIQHKRLALLGEPGSGKSVFVNYLAYLLTQAQLHGADLPPGWPGLAHWPVRFILRELAARLNPADLTSLTPGRQDHHLLALADDYLSQQLTDMALPAAQVETWAACLSQRPCLLIFDGLDEVPLDYLPWTRRLIELLTRRYPGRVIVTCRIRSYEGEAKLPGFESDTLAPFTTAQRDLFIDRWYQARPALTETERRHRQADLRRAVRDLPPELTTNPLLLTTLALIHTAGAELPKRRAELYKRGVEVLLHHWQKPRWGQAGLLQQLGVEPDRLLEALRELAYQAHQVAAPGRHADLNYDQVVGQLDRKIFHNAETSKQFLAYVDRQAGLLVGEGGSREKPPIYHFAHRTFQEYLAGCYLAAQRQGLARAVTPLLAEGERWYLVAQLAAEEMLFNNVQPGPVLDLLYMLCPAEVPPSEAGWRGVAWAGVIAVTTGPERIRQDKTPGCALGEQFLSRLTPRLETIVGQGLLTLAERADAGDALAALNADTRPGVGLLPPPARPALSEVEGGRAREGVKMEDIPNLEFCLIPTGPFWLGSLQGKDDWAEGDEYGHDQPYHLPYPYWLSRYPVTQAQYQAFVRAAGHRVPYEEADWARPYNWLDGAPPPHRRNHPVVLVSRADAAAYCAWLTEQLTATGRLSVLQEHLASINSPSKIQNPKFKIAVRLPTEAEWEKAARGGLEIPAQPYLISIGANSPSPRPETGLSMQPNPLPQRRWPWGEWSDDSPHRHANVAETNRGGTMAVGSFPAGASPYGCLDLAGNVWEWAHSQYRPYPYRLNDDREKEAARTDVRYTVRGGSWYVSRRSARVSSRDLIFSPVLFSSDIGFRCVVAPVFA